MQAVIESAKAHLGLGSSSKDDWPDRQVTCQSKNRTTEPMASQGGDIDNQTVQVFTNQTSSEVQKKSHDRMRGPSQLGSLE